MSFHSTITATAAWPADVVSALGLTANDVYVGRREQHVHRSEVEVLIRRAETVEQDGGAFGAVRSYPYDVVISARDLDQGRGTGTEQQTTVEAHARTLVDRYHGQVPTFLASNTPSGSTPLCMNAGELSIDTNPDDGTKQQATLRVVFNQAE